MLMFKDELIKLNFQKIFVLSFARQDNLEYVGKFWNEQIGKTSMRPKK